MRQMVQPPTKRARSGKPQQKVTMRRCRYEHTVLDRPRSRVPRLPSWNPNVMVEVDYRLAIEKPLVILAPRGLSFDLANRCMVMLPDEPREMNDRDRSPAVA